MPQINIEAGNPVAAVVAKGERALANWDTISDAQKDAVLKHVLRAVLFIIKRHIK